MYQLLQPASLPACFQPLDTYNSTARHTVVCCCTQCSRCHTPQRPQRPYMVKCTRYLTPARGAAQDVTQNLTHPKKARKTSSNSESTERARICTACMRMRGEASQRALIQWDMEHHVQQQMCLTQTPRMAAVGSTPLVATAPRLCRYGGGGAAR